MFLYIVLRIVKTEIYIYITHSCQLVIRNKYSNSNIFCWRTFMLLCNIHFLCRELVPFFRHKTPTKHNLSCGEKKFQQYTLLHKNCHARKYIQNPCCCFQIDLSSEVISLSNIPYFTTFKYCSYKMGDSVTWHSYSKLHRICFIRRKRLM